MGWLQYRLGNHEKALELLKRAYEKLEEISADFADSSARFTTRIVSDFSSFFRCRLFFA